GAGVHRRADPAQPRRQHRRCTLAGHPLLVDHPPAALRRGEAGRRHQAGTGASGRRPGGHRRHHRRPGGRLRGGAVTLSALRAPRPSALPADGELGLVPIGALALDDGTVLPEVTIAVKRWGALSPARDNVVLALHALTGDTHATGPADEHNPAPGWWDGLIGPGLALDTDRWCVIATNVVGGCGGST